MRRYIFLGNATEWWEYCLADAKDYDNISLFNQFILEKPNTFKYFFASIHFSERINRHILLPGKSIWYGSFCKYIGLNRVDDIVIVMYDWHPQGRNVDFLKYIREHYENVHIVYVLTNIIALGGAGIYNFTDKLNKYYDAVFAFDPDDAKRYGFLYSPLVYSKKLVSKKKSEKDIFYVGKAKDRLDMLLSVYKRLKELGKSSIFYVAQADDTSKYNDEIIYNHPITYAEALNGIAKCDCLVDVIQGNSSGLTIKVCEAIYHGKKLITTNENLKEYSFYDARFMRIIKRAEDIDSDFFDNNKVVEYSQEGIDYFSLNSLLNRIDIAISESRGIANEQ